MFQDGLEYLFRVGKVLKDIVRALGPQNIDGIVAGRHRDDPDMQVAAAVDVVGGIPDQHDLFAKKLVPGVFFGRVQSPLGQVGPLSGPVPESAEGKILVQVVGLELEPGPFLVITGQKSHQYFRVGVDLLDQPDHPGLQNDVIGPFGDLSPERLQVFVPHYRQKLSDPFFRDAIQT